MDRNFCPLMSRKMLFCLTDRSFFLLKMNHMIFSRNLRSFCLQMICRSCFFCPGCHNCFSCRSFHSCSFCRSCRSCVLLMNVHSSFPLKRHNFCLQMSRSFCLMNGHSCCLSGRKMICPLNCKDVFHNSYLLNFPNVCCQSCRRIFFLPVLLMMNRPYRKCEAVSVSAFFLLR